MELCQEVLGGVIGETHVGGNELLVQHGSPEETRQLLFFRGIARKRKSVTQAREDKAGDAALKGSIECEAPRLKSEGDIAMTDFDVVWSGDRVDVL